MGKILLIIRHCKGKDLALSDPQSKWKLYFLSGIFSIMQHISLSAQYNVLHESLKMKCIRSRITVCVVHILRSALLIVEMCAQLLSHVQHFEIIPWQAPLSMEFSRQEYWSGLPCPPPGDLPDPGIEPKSSAWQAISTPSEPPGKPE